MNKNHKIQNILADFGGTKSLHDKGRQGKQCSSWQDGMAGDGGTTMSTDARDKEDDKSIEEIGDEEIMERALDTEGGKMEVMEENSTSAVQWSSLWSQKSTILSLLVTI